MNDLEDEPQDVQDATPVEDEIKEGEVDKVKEKPEPEPISEDEFEEEEEESEDDCANPCKRRKLKKIPSPFMCKNPKPALKRDCCDRKRRKPKNSLIMWVNDKECKHESYSKIPRKCLTNEEWLDMMATPKKKCDNCAKIPQRRRFKDVPCRIYELAKPKKVQVVSTMQTYGANLPPHQLENLMNALEEESTMTPEQAEVYLQEKRDCARRKILDKIKKRKERKSCYAERGSCDAGDPCLDSDAVNCMYAMALKFVRALLSWTCCIPREDYKDIAEVVLERLAEILDYQPIGDEDKKSQQMRVLADLIACWIANVLMCVAEKNKAALLDECLKKRAELEELEGLEDVDADSDVYLDAEDYDKSTIIVPDDDEWTECDEGLDTSEVGVGTDIDTKDQSVGEDDEGESIEVVGVDDPLDEEIQTDVGEDKISETDKTPDDIEMERLGRSCSLMLNNDLCFLSFAKILETLFCLIDCVSESTLQCPMDNRIHRAIYSKLEDMARLDNPKLLTKKMKDIIDVISGKLAKFVRKSLQDAEIAFMEEHPAQVESKEVREWTKRLTEMTTVVEDWSGWLEKVICEACKLRSKKKVTRGDWWEWTSKFEANAMLFRRTYLEAIHDEHHDIMMICDREVCKTGQMKNYCQDSEVVMKKTSFESCKRFLERGQNPDLETESQMQSQSRSHSQSHSPSVSHSQPQSQSNSLSQRA